MTRVGSQRHGKKKNNKIKYIYSSTIKMVVARSYVRASCQVQEYLNFNIYLRQTLTSLSLRFFS
jgi:hypothetical protein